MQPVAHYKYGNYIIKSQVDLQPLPVVKQKDQSIEFSILLPSQTRLPRFENAAWFLHLHQSDQSIFLSLGRDQGAYLLRFPQLATFRVVPETGVIDCFPEATLPPHTLAHLLLDQVLPRLISHRGGASLHASAVLVENAAIVFCGESGWGKSTLALSFDRHGYPALSDDVIIITQAATGVYAQAPYAGLRVWPQTIAGMAGSAAVVTPVSHYNSKSRLASQSHPTIDHAPVKAIFLLGEPASSRATKITPAAPTEALMALVKARFRLDTEDRATLRQELDQFAMLAESIPFFHLDYQRRFSRLQTVRQAILNQLDLAG